MPSTSRRPPSAPERVGGLRTNVVQAKAPERFLDALKQVVKAGMPPEKVAEEFGLS